MKWIDNKKKSWGWVAEPEKPFFHKWSVFVNLLISVFTLLLVLCSQRNIKTANESIELQKEYYQATTRPFVGAYLDSSYKVNAFFVISYSLTNHGSLPARDMQSLCILKEKPDTTLKNTIYIPKNVSYALYPHETQQLRKSDLTLSISGISVDSTYVTKISPTKDLYLHICVFYRAVDSRDFYTTYIYLIKPNGYKQLLRIIFD